MLLSVELLKQQQKWPTNENDRLARRFLSHARTLRCNKTETNILKLSCAERNWEFAGSLLTSDCVFLCTPLIQPSLLLSSFQCACLFDFRNDLWAIVQWQRQTRHTHHKKTRTTRNPRICMHSLLLLHVRSLWLRTMHRFSLFVHFMQSFCSMVAFF